MGLFVSLYPKDLLVRSLLFGWLFTNAWFPRRWCWSWFWTYVFPYMRLNMLWYIPLFSWFCKEIDNIIEWMRYWHHRQCQRWKISILWNGVDRKTSGGYVGCSTESKRLCRSGKQWIWRGQDDQMAKNDIRRGVGGVFYASTRFGMFRICTDLSLHLRSSTPHLLGLGF